MVYVSWAVLPQVGGSAVASCFRAGGMPGTAFLAQRAVLMPFPTNVRCLM